jgi:imidazolonepropionase-like amidohydrolase
MRPAVAADLIIDNAAQIVTCEPTLGDGTVGVVERGAIAASSERVTWIGPVTRLPAEVEPAPNCRRIDARGHVVLPGFVDSHTHLVFAGTREKEYAMRARGASYQEIAAAGGGIRATVRATRRQRRDADRARETASRPHERVSTTRPSRARGDGHGARHADCSDRASRRQGGLKASA